MASDVPELDLYADDIGDEFTQEYNDNDLYDDVLTSNSKQQQKNNGPSNSNLTSNDDESQSQQKPLNGNNSSSNASNSNSSNTGNSLLSGNQNNDSSTNITSSSTNHHVRKPCFYVGNLTWWTTDEDVRKACSEIGLNDVTEVKFFENRGNGQSKGFCVVTMQSEQSVRVAMDKLKNISIQGQNPVVTACNRQNLNNFELKSRKPGTNGQANQNQNNSSNNSNNNNSSSNNTNNNSGSNFMLNNRSNFNQNQGMQSSQRPPLIPRPMRPNPPLLNNAPSIAPNMPHQSMRFGNSNSQPWNQMMSNGPRNMSMQTGSNHMNPMMRFNQANRQIHNQPLLNAPANQVDLRTQLSSVSGMSGIHNPINAAHAALLSQTGLLPPSSAADLFANRIAGIGAFGGSHSANDFARSGLDPLQMQMSEAEFEEILNKNKNLSNNAISRALNDAASGDYSAAIDTLSTAISLIKGSRVSHDERCKILISSLQDTLQTIEQKSYSSAGSGGSRSKDRLQRSRSRDRDHRGSSSHRGSGGRSSNLDKDRGRGRDRSRSRDRDYRERSRDRYHDDHHRHHDDRYRDKDRERDYRRH